MSRLVPPSSASPMAVDSRRYHRAGTERLPWREGAVVALVLSLALYRFTATVADPDLWGHIKFGEVVWQAGRVALPDPFSYLTRDRLWINHEWLSEVVFYLVFTAGGAAGLIALKAALGLAVMAAVYRHLCRQGLTAVQAAIIVVAVVHFFLMSLVTVRTLILSYPLFLLVLLLIHDASARPSRAIWSLPALFVFWANLHPAFLAGFGVLGIWAAIEVLAGRLALSRALLLVGACGLAPAFNPYGLMLWGFLLQTALVPRPDISEWQPLVLMTRFGLAYAAFVALALWGLIYSRRPRRGSLMAVLVVTALLPLVAIRHTPLAALAIAVIAGEHVGDAWNRCAAARRNPARPATWLPVTAIAAALLLGILALPQLTCIRITPEIGGSYPARAVGLIRQSGVTANLAIDFDWGEYALYHLSPAVKVSVDGRRETAYDAVTYGENLAFKYGEGEWDALLRNPDTDLALVRRGFPTFNLLMLSPGWRPVYHDSLAALFSRDSGPIGSTLLGTTPPDLPPDGAGLCFP
jgi:hypothetical protein